MYCNLSDIDIDIDADTDLYRCIKFALCVCVCVCVERRCYVFFFLFSNIYQCYTTYHSFILFFFLTCTYYTYRL